MTVRNVIVCLLLTLESLSCRGPSTAPAPGPSSDHSGGIRHYVYAFHALHLFAGEVSGTIGEVRNREDAYGLLAATEMIGGEGLFRDIVLDYPPAFHSGAPEASFHICSWTRDSRNGSSGREHPAAGRIAQPTSSAATRPSYRIYYVDFVGSSGSHVDSEMEIIDGGLVSPGAAFKIIERGDRPEHKIRLVQEEITDEPPPRTDMDTGRLMTPR